MRWSKYLSVDIWHRWWLLAFFDTRLQKELALTRVLADYLSCFDLIDLYCTLLNLCLRAVSRLGIYNEMVFLAASKFSHHFGLFSILKMLSVEPNKFRSKIDLVFVRLEDTQLRGVRRLYRKE